MHDIKPIVALYDPIKNVDTALLLDLNGISILSKEVVSNYT